MVDKSATLPNRRYVWAVSVPAARAKVGIDLVKEGLAPNKSLLPKLIVTWVRVSRPGSYDWDGNAVDGFQESPANTVRRYRVDVQV